MLIAAKRKDKEEKQRILDKWLMLNPCRLSKNILIIGIIVESGMSKKPLEAIVNAVTLPDKILKLGYDAIAALTQKTTGKDRFDLARYAALGAGASFGASAAVYAIRYDYALVPAAVLGVIAQYFAAQEAAKWREYFSVPTETLDLDKTNALSLGRKFRFPAVAVAAAVGVIPYLISPERTTATEILQQHFPIFLADAGLLLTTSYSYLIDGNYSYWDKAKSIVKTAYQKARDFAGVLVPGHLPQPLPEPAPA